MTLCAMQVLSKLCLLEQVGVSCVMMAKAKSFQKLPHSQPTGLGENKPLRHGLASNLHPHIKPVTSCVPTLPLRSSRILFSPDLQVDRHPRLHSFPYPFILFPFTIFVKEPLLAWLVRWGTQGFFLPGPLSPGVTKYY